MASPTQWTWVWVNSGRQSRTGKPGVLESMGSQRVGHDWATNTFTFNVQFSRSVVSNSLWPHGLQHTRLPCPSPISRACSNSCPLNQWCHPTISSFVNPFSPFPVFPSIKVFSNELALCIKWPKYWNFSFSISPSNKYSGLISLRIDWFYLLAVQGAVKSLLQHYNLKASILWHSAFFIIQFSHLYMTTEKNHSFDYTDLCWQSDVSAF